MFKKILKVSSIVIASVLAFVGAVIGVLAIMGKFKDPVVYPDRLEFESIEKPVVLSGKENGTEGLEYKYFILGGFSNSEEPVNRKTCFVTFEKGADLIELLDNNFDPIAIENNRYKVNCNEPIYYRLKDSAKNLSSTDGVVRLRARDEKNMVVSSNVLTINIDRPVEDLYLDYSPADTYQNNIQRITLGIGIRQDLVFASSPKVALNPIASMDEKIVEIYYNDPSNPSDLILLSADKTSDKESGYDFLKLDNNQLYFESDTAGVYQFRISVFDTYEARENYINNLDPNRTPSNNERTHSMVTTELEISVVNSNVEAVSMTTSGVALNLYSDNNYITLGADKTGVNNNNLGLSMTRDGRYSELRFNEVGFTLDEAKYPSAWTGAGVAFESAGGRELIFNQGLDFNSGTVRLASGFDGVDPTVDYGYHGEFNESNKTVTLTAQINGRAYQFVLTLGNIVIGDKTVISSITYDDVDSGTISFTCSNGLAFYETIEDNAGSQTHNIKLLRTGSYLEFYVYNSETNTYTRASKFNYELSTPTGSGRNRSWNIIVKNDLSLQVNESLVLGIIVVNNNGGNLLFHSVNVRISEIGFNYSILNSGSHTLQVNYLKRDNEYSTIYGELPFNEIVDISAGSYNTGVLVTALSDRYDVDVIDSVRYVIGSGDNAREYVLVGYAEADGEGRLHFINKVRVRAGASNIGTDVYLVQLMNGYQQTAEDMVDELINSVSVEETKSLDNIVKRNFIDNSNRITINVEYELIASETNISFDTVDEFVQVEGGRVTVVENTPNTHTIYISGNITNMIANIWGVSNASEFARDNLVFKLYNSRGELLTSNPNNIYISGEVRYNAEESRLEIPYKVDGALTDSGAYITFSIVYKGVTAVSMPIYIRSTEPTDVTLKLTNGQELNLPTNEQVARNENSPYLEVTIGYNGNYTYSYTLHYKDDKNVAKSYDIANISSFFNMSSNGGANTGFIVYPQINGIEKFIIYDSTNKSVFSFEDYAIRVGESIITISSGSINRSLLVRVVAETNASDENLFTLTSSSDVREVTNNEYVLSADKTGEVNNVRYTYNGTNIELKYPLVEVGNIHGVDFGGDSQLTIKDSDFTTGSEWTTKYQLVTANDTIVLEVAVNSEGEWRIRRTNYLYTRLKLSFDVTTPVISTPVTITLEFTSSIEVSINSEWNTTVYADTKVLLLEESTNDSYTNQSLFRIKNASGGESVSVSVTNATKDTSANVYSFNTGISTITFEFNETIIARYEIDVLPNLLAVETNAGEFKSDTTDIETDKIFTLKQYDTSYTYGTTNAGGTGYVMYTDDRLINYTIGEDTSAYSVVTISSDKGENSTIRFSADKSTFSTLWLESINETHLEKLTIKYGAYTLNTINVNIVNKYADITTNYDATYVDGDKYFDATTNSFEIMVGRALNSFVTNNSTAYNTLQDIEITYFDTNTNADVVLNTANGGITITGSQFIINHNISGEIVVSSIKFVFAESGETNVVTYTIESNDTLKVRILPYLPKTNDIVDAYSNLDFDLISGIFEDLANDDAISSVIISETSEPFTNADIIGRGYTSTNSELNVRLNPITGESKVVTITFVVTYVGGVQSSFDYPLTIKNSLAIELDYPFNDLVLSTDGANIRMIFTNADDGNNLGTYIAGAISDLDSNPRYVLHGEYNYETALVGQTINFRHDETTGTDRVKVYNHEDTRVIDDFAIELVAYYNANNVIRYVHSGSIVVDKIEKSVRFDSNSAFTAGSSMYLIFKVTTSSGNYDYYFINLINPNSAISNVDSSTVVSLNASASTIQKFVDSTNNTILGETFNTRDFENKFHVSTELSNIDLYLLGIEDLKDSENLLNKITYTDTTTGEIKTASLGDKINEYTLSQLYNYTTIRLGVIYRNTQIVNLGSILVRVSPVVTETSALTSENNGIYSVTLNANDRGYSNPFSVAHDGNNMSLSSVSLAVSEEYARLITIDDTTGDISITGNITNDDLEFSVTYVYDLGSVQTGESLTLIVNYVLPRLDIDTTPTTVNVGAFDGEKFDNRLALSSLVGNYNRRISVLGEEIDLSQDKGNKAVADGVQYVYDSTDNKAYLEFTQGTIEKSMSFTIGFLDINDGELSRNITVIIASGVHIVHPTASVGYNLANAMNAVSYKSLDNFYRQNKGSSITFTREKQSAYTKYSIGGLEIYTNNDSTLDITFSDPDFVLGKGADNNVSITEGQKVIDFTHNPQEGLALTLNIQIKDSAGETYRVMSNNVETPLVHQFYVNLAKTYNGIKAVYTVNGADHENVVADTDGFNLTEHLFGRYNNEGELIKETAVNDMYSNTNIINDIRVKLVTDKNEEIFDYLPSAIGFTDKNSPNFVSFATSGALITTDSTNKYQNIRFSSIGTGVNSQSVVVDMSIRANTSSVERYQFYVVPDDRIADDFTILVDSNDVKKNENKDNTGYISLLVTDTGANANSWALSEDIGEKIAELDDKRNSTFTISSAELSVTPSSITLTQSVYKSVNTENNSVSYTISLSASGTTYYTVTLTLSENKELYANVTRNTTSLFDILTLKVSMHGDSGYIAKDLQIKFFNIAISSDYSTQYDNIWASESVYLTTSSEPKIMINPNKTNSDTFTNDKISLDLINTTYRVGSREQTSTTSTNNAVIDFEKGTNLLNTRAVAEDTNVTMNFRVSYDNYILCSIDYRVHLMPNFKFKVNGSELPSGNTRFETEYDLNTAHLTGVNFPYTDDMLTSQSGGDDLLVGLFTKSDNSPLTSSRITFEILEGNEFDNETIIDKAELSKGNLYLKQDISGVLELVLKVDLKDNGVYLVYWDIHITGFMTITYGAGGENTIITQSGEPYKSGASVKLLSTSTDSGVKFDSKSLTLTGKTNVERAVIPYTNELDVRDKSITYGDISATIEGSSVSTILPAVPQSASSAPEYYLAIYKITVEYYGLTRDIYVTYMLTDDLKISANNDATSIDVDKMLTNIGDSTAQTGLKLLHFEEQYTISGEKDPAYRIYLVKNQTENTYDYVMKLAGETTDPISLSKLEDNRMIFGSNNDQYEFAPSGNTWIVKHTTKQSGTDEITTDTKTTTRSIVGSAGGTVFISSYANVREFKTFLEGVTSIEFNNATGVTNSLEGTIRETLTFDSLKDFGGGTFGIDLLDNAVGGKLFNNELVANVSIKSGNTTVVSIPAYNGNYGFRLKTESAIKANAPVRLNSMFINRYLTGVDDKLRNVDIVGISNGANPETSWFTSTTGTIVTGSVNDELGTIRVPSGTNTYNEYRLYSFVYSLSETGANPIYNLEKTFYAISSPNGQVAVVNYSSDIQSYFFLMTGETALSYRNIIKVYGNDLRNPTYVTPTDITPTGEHADCVTIDTTSQTIMPNIDKLRELGTDGYVTIYLTATYNGVTLQVRIDYDLNSLPK